MQKRWFLDWTFPGYWLIIGSFFCFTAALAGESEIGWWFVGFAIGAYLAAAGLAVRGWWIDPHHRRHGVTEVFQSRESTLESAMVDAIAIVDGLKSLTDTGSPEWMRCNVCEVYLSSHGTADHAWVEWDGGPRLVDNRGKNVTGRPNILSPEWAVGPGGIMELGSSGRLVPVPTTWEVEEYHVDGGPVFARGIPPWSQGRYVHGLIQRGTPGGYAYWVVDISELSVDERAAVYARDKADRDAKYRAARKVFDQSDDRLL